MNKVVRDGLVAVLYSPGYGGGWYSWNPDVPECLFDPEIVAAVERADATLTEEDRHLGRRDPVHRRRDMSEVQALAEKKWPGGYWGGADDLQIEWLPEGTLFEIEEYDGNEGIHLAANQKWIVA